MHRCTLIVVLNLAVPVCGQMISYEGNSFPEETGWERRPRSNQPERWLNEGWLQFRCAVIDPEICVGEDDFYRWDLDDFAGAQRFMLEWSVITDGPRSEILDVAPTTAVASGQSGIRFHTTVAHDQVRFFDDIFDAHWIDLRRSAHAFRLDIYGEHWYEWSIDGSVQVAERPDKQYPTADSFIIWGVRAACDDSESAFDYVRFGIPEDEPAIDCDSIRTLKGSCRDGKIKAKLKSALEPGAELTLTNNGDHRVMRVKPNGKAKAKYKHQSGEHTLLLLNCPAISQDITCGP